MNMLGTPTLEILVFLGRHYRNSYYVRELAKILTIGTGAASGQTPGTGGVGPRDKRAEREDSIVQSQYLTPDREGGKNFCNPGRTLAANRCWAKWDRADDSLWQLCGGRRYF